MSEPVTGSHDDYLVKVITEVGAEISTDALAHINIDDRQLVMEARELPQLMFYYTACYQRMNLRAEQLEIRQKEVEAETFVALKEQSRASGADMPVDEIKARVTTALPVRALRAQIAEITSKRDTLKGVLDSLRQKGYSLQLIGSIKAKENDWLADSFSRRLEGHPQRDQLVPMLANLLGFQPK